MVAERGSAGNEPSQKRNNSNKNRSKTALQSKNKKEKLVERLFEGKNENKDVSLADDLYVSSSDDDFISIEPDDTKNLIFEIENNLCKESETIQPECATETLRVIVNNDIQTKEPEVREKFIETRTPSIHPQKPANSNNQKPKQKLKSQVVVPKKEQNLNRPIHSSRSNWHKRQQNPNQQKFSEHCDRQPTRPPFNEPKPFPGNNPFARKPNKRYQPYNTNNRRLQTPEQSHTVSVPNTQFQTAPTVTHTSTDTLCRCNTHTHVAQSSGGNVTLSVDALVKLLNARKPKRSHGKAQRLQKAEENKFKREHGFEAWWEKYGKPKK